MTKALYSRLFALAGAAALACTAPKLPLPDAGEPVPDAGAAVVSEVDAGSPDAGAPDAGSPGPCATRATATACAADDACVWLVPACEEPTLANAACFPAVECRTSADCAMDRACIAVYVDSCSDFGADCDTCAVLRSTCLTIAEDPCFGAHLGRGGACVGPSDTPLTPGCCPGRNCDPATVSCRADPPTCLEHERASVFEGCWGPCVPIDSCAPGSGEQGLCTSTGGTWDAAACGHTRCGLRPECNAIIPGCDCGLGKVFGRGEGCVVSTECLAQLDERCGPGVPGSPVCAPGLICPGADEPEGTGTCDLSPGYVCTEGVPCPVGARCCPICDAQGCRSVCFRATAECPPVEP